MFNEYFNTRCDDVSVDYSECVMSTLTPGCDDISVDYSEGLVSTSTPDCVVSVLITVVCLMNTLSSDCNGISVVSVYTYRIL